MDEELFARNWRLYDRWFGENPGARNIPWDTVVAIEEAGVSLEVKIGRDFSRVKSQHRKFIKGMQAGTERWRKMDELIEKYDVDMGLLVQPDDKMWASHMEKATSWAIANWYERIIPEKTLWLFDEVEDMFTLRSLTI